RPAHPRLVHPPALLGASGLHLSTHAPALHPGGTCLDRTASRSGPFDPSRRFSAASSTSSPGLDGAAGSIHPTGVALPQRSGGQHLLAAAHTGMRIGECVDLSWDCLRNVAPDRWAIHVPLGKLKTERMVPVDSFVCGLVQRLRFFRSFEPLLPDGHLLSRPHGKTALDRKSTRL